jgi:hypothetical protein
MTWNSLMARQGATLNQAKRFRGDQFLAHAIDFEPEIVLTFLPATADQASPTSWQPSLRISHLPLTT